MQETRGNFQAVNVLEVVKKLKEDNELNAAIKAYFSFFLSFCKFGPRIHKISL